MSSEDKSQKVSQLYTVDEHGKLTLHFHPAQTRGWESEEDVVVLMGGAQSGKGLAIDTEIPTPNGFVLMSSLEVGDMVFDMDGSPCQITGVSEINNIDCYKITFDDGSLLVADSDHQWRVQDRKQRKNQDRNLKKQRRDNFNWNWGDSRPQCRPKPYYSVLTTRELIDDLLLPPRKNRVNPISNYSIDVPSPAQYHYRSLPLPPYYFGAWLGDGCSTAPSITCSEIEIIDRCEKGGIYFSSKWSNHNSDSTFVYYASEYRDQKIIHLLRELGVIGNKHIPEMYLTASVEQRIDLLQGLMDTDGYIGEKSAVCEYTSVKLKLALGVLELVRSLGIKCRMKIGRAMLNGKDCGSKYRVCFALDVDKDICAFGMERKLNRCRGDRKPCTRRLYIRSVESIKSIPTRCISVDSVDDVYLCTRSYIPTHNTSFVPWWLRREIMRTARSGQPNNYLAVSASNDLFAMAFLPAMIEVFVDVLGIGHYWTARRTLEIKCLDPDDKFHGKFYQGKNGSSSGTMWARIVLRSAQSEGALESVTALAAALDEAGQSAFTTQDWEAINRRVAISRSRGAGRILIATTPYSMDSFLYEQVYIPWVEHGKKSKIEVIQFPSYYNPNWTMEEFRRQEASMPEWRAAMFLHGRFKRPAGLIYRDFDESTMLIREGDEFTPPLHWERVVGVDFGGANTATIWLALNPDDGRWYAYHESLMGHMPTSEHASIAIAESQGIEHLTAVGGAKSEGQPRDDWWNAGFYIEEPPVYDLEAGIARVISLIKKDNLRVFSSMTRLRRELRNYSRKLDQNNEATEQIINKNKFHMCDALRYAGVWIEDAPLGAEVMTYQQYMESQAPPLLLTDQYVQQMQERVYANTA